VVACENAAGGTQTTMRYVPRDRTENAPSILGYGERLRLQQELLTNIQRRLPELENLLAQCAEDRQIEDLVYRFWHQSMKAYALEHYTERIVAALADIAPTGCTLHPWFLRITADGTGKTFTLEHNEDWPGHVRPILEAYFHAEYMLRMAVTYGKELAEPPTLLPSGWAALLTLYGVR